MGNYGTHFLGVRGGEGWRREVWGRALLEGEGKHIVYMGGGGGGGVARVEDGCKLTGNWVLQLSLLLLLLLS